MIRLSYFGACGVAAEIIMCVVFIVLVRPTDFLEVMQLSSGVRYSGTHTA